MLGYAVDSPAVVLGRGAFSEVTSAVRLSDGRRVAIKRVDGVLESEETVSQVLRELSLHRLLDGRGHGGSVARLLDVFETGDCGSVSMVFERHGPDLAHWLWSLREEARVLGQGEAMKVARQLVERVCGLHGSCVAHRDLKPQNILVDVALDGSIDGVVVCDLGMSRAWSESGGASGGESGRPWTDYVTTRWYRAPEVLCGCCSCDDYGPQQLSDRHRWASADMWSVGCILAELFSATLRPGGSPLASGRDATQQAMMIGGLLGRMDRAEKSWYAARVGPSCAEVLRSMQLHGRPFSPRDGVEKSLRGVPGTVRSLVASILSYLPGDRPTASEALRILRLSDCDYSTVRPADRFATPMRASRGSEGIYGNVGALPSSSAAVEAAKADVRSEMEACAAHFRFPLREA